jgi:hypothetical protein
MCRLSVFLKEFLRLVDLCCEVRTAATIRVVQHHKSTVALANLLLGEVAFAGGEVCQFKLLGSCTVHIDLIAGLEGSEKKI